MDNTPYTTALTALRTAYEHMQAVRRKDTTAPADAEEVRSGNRLIALCKRVAEDYKDSPT